MILAAGGGKEGADSFLDSALGQVVTTIAGIVGFLVVIIGLFTVIKDFSKGKIGAGVKVIIGCVLLAALLFNLQLAISAIDWLGTIVKDGIDSVKEVT